MHLEKILNFEVTFISLASTLPKRQPLTWVIVSMVAVKLFDDKLNFDILELQDGVMGCESVKDGSISIEEER